MVDVEAGRERALASSKARGGGGEEQEEEEDDEDDDDEDEDDEEEEGASACGRTPKRTAARVAAKSRQPVKRIRSQGSRMPPPLGTEKCVLAVVVVVVVVAVLIAREKETCIRNRIGTRIEIKVKLVNK